MAMRLGILAAIVVAFVVGHFALRPPVRDGRTIFMEEGCVKCHSIGDLGVGEIPLDSVVRRRSDVWLRDHIENPKVHDPTIGMPSFGYLSEREIDSLVDFLHRGQ